MSRARKAAEAAFIQVPRMGVFARGFFLGALYASGQSVTSATIRTLCKVSRATAKRDMAEIAALAARAAVLIHAPPGRARVALRRNGPR